MTVDEVNTKVADLLGFESVGIATDGFVQLRSRPTVGLS
jgi:hypothetical protein